MGGFGKDQVAGFDPTAMAGLGKDHFKSFDKFSLMFVYSKIRICNANINPK